MEKLKACKSQGLETVWFFMHQNNERYVPEACDYFIKKLNKDLGTTVAGPKFLIL